jgi:hypothetical protein
MLNTLWNVLLLAAYLLILRNILFIPSLSLLFNKPVQQIHMVHATTLGVVSNMIPVVVVFVLGQTIRHQIAGSSMDYLTPGKNY